MWYLYNVTTGIIFGTCSMEPDLGDLATRGESAFYSPEQYELGWKVIFDDEGNPIGASPAEESKEGPQKE